MLPRDVSPEQLRKHDEMIRRASEIQRARALDSMFVGVRQLGLAGIRHDHPGATLALCRWLLIERIYGRATAERLLGPRPPQ